MRKRKFKRIKKKKQLYQYKAFWMAVLVALLSGSAGYALFLSSWFQITQVLAQGGDASIEEKVVAMVIPQNIFLFNAKNLEQALQEAFPEITDIAITKKFPQTLSIAFQRRAGVASWCENEQCFAVDAKGVVFEQRQPGAELLVSFESDATLGKSLMEFERWNTVLDFQKRAENLSSFHNLNLTFRSVDIISETRANWKTSEQWEVYTNLQENLEWQLLKLQAVLEKKISPERRSLLLYIDLRFGDQAYLKYR